MQKPPNHFYTLVAREFKNDTKDEGIWIQAFAKAEGDKTKADALYVDLRAHDLWTQYKNKEEEEKRKAAAEQARRLERENLEKRRIAEEKEEARLRAEKNKQREIPASLEPIDDTVLITLGVSVLFGILIFLATKLT